ncbi:uncharacterized protein STEHIDRAFT_139258 [Stereum hirsutum FP-91666 SS1]|uniref:uncharacterized protein n=1 Tax=Stereum hirsutum (strain FP-91666) TaxID=721885 RepID=UPI000440C5F4|nr:uncharacterized protein STEHIDRAFT_139258 [Stereum hirsutum FP-91666 SS1]EIM87657.1 hypothetical protein STEHIDRAFT_139258 [Stereum hirsutum FP-91666 SS1]
MSTAECVGTPQHGDYNPQSGSFAVLNTFMSAESGGINQSLPETPHEIHTRSQLNQESRLCALPAEIISHILVCLADVDEPWGFAGTRSLGWFKVLHVCRRIREVALTTPRLWNNICFDLGSDCTREMMERARVVPVTVLRHCRRKGETLGPEVKEYVPQNLWHIRRLMLSGPSDEVEKLVHKLVHPAPMLEDIHFWPQTLDRSEPIPMPPVLFAGHTPRLHSVVLDYCTIHWDSPMFRNLIRLELCVDRGSAPPPLMSKLLDILDTMPLLESFRLEYCLPMLQSPSVPSITRVCSLPNLLTLTLGGRALDIVHLMRSISYPATTSLHLDLDAWDADPTLHEGKDCCAILPVLRAQLERAADPIITKLSTIPFTPNVYNAHAVGNIDGTKIRIDLRVKLPMPDEYSGVEFLADFHDSLPGVEACETVRAHFCEMMDADDWLTVYNGLNNVKRFEVTYPNSIVSLIEALGEVMRREYEIQVGATTQIISHTLPRLFPHLLDLDFTCVDFETPEKDEEGDEHGGEGFGGEGEDERQEKEPPFVLLQRCLQKRAELGSPLERLGIQSSEIKRSQVNLLSEVVPNLSWDEKEMDHE